MRRRGLVAVAAAVLLLTGCATAGPGTPAPEETPTPEFTAQPLVPLTHPDVLAYCPEQPAGHLDVSPAEVVAVYRCTSELGLDGAATVEYVDRLLDDSAELLDAYGVADAERPGDIVCTLEMADPLLIWLELANDETVAVRAPTDECGKPQLGARAALVSARYETVLSQPLDTEE